MLPRGEAAAGFAVAAAFFLATGAFGFAPVFLTAIFCFGAETGVFAFAFFADFLTDFLAVFFAADFLAVFFAFLTSFFAFFTAALLFFARFFDAAVLAARCDTFLVFFFFEGFFLATTIPNNSSTGIDGIAPETERLPRRFRKHPEHRENQRFSLEIVLCGVARGAGDLFPHLRQPCKARQVRVGIGVIRT